MRPFPRTLLLAAGALAVAAPLAAQSGPSLEANVGVHSAYVWRGINVTNRPVVQPELALSLPSFGGALTAGAFASVEPGRYDGLRDLSESGDDAAVDVAEYQLWLEYGRGLGPVEVALGATTYRFPNDAGLTSTSNTSEVYGTVALAIPLRPSVGVWYDVDKVRGAYVEAAVSYDTRLFLVVPVTVGAAAGFNAGQEISFDTDELANFAERGMTHTELSLSSSFGVGRLTVTPSAQAIFGRDVATRLIEPGRESDAKYRIGATIGWGR
jgi:hypothetical protein